MAVVQNRIDGYFTRISDIIKKGKIPARIKFMLQDVQELRRNEWVPRLNQTSTLKTIDQVSLPWQGQCDFLLLGQGEDYEVIGFRDPDCTHTPPYLAMTCHSPV